MTRIRFFCLWVLFLSVLLSLPACDSNNDSVETKEGGSLSLAEVLTSDESEGFAKVLESRTFSFPADHGPHLDFKSEWWYFTGNLTSASRNDFGFQFTLFRSALSREKPSRPSKWGTNQAYMAHFALTDVDEEAFHSFERFGRDVLGLAGARAEPFEIRLDDWYVQEVGKSDEPDVPQMRLYAFEDGVGLDLVLTSAKPIVLQGDEGRSVKGDHSENASYYYSLTRLQAKGKAILPSGDVEVTGLAWMDREWSSRALGDNTIGWDWFALQLDNGCELMIYQLRRKDGSVSPHSHGCLVDRQGKWTGIERHLFEIEVLSQWDNGKGASYPSQWRIRIPGHDIDLEVKPRVADQELDFRFQYWEGTVAVTGEMGDEPVKGRGYVELTGYAGEPIRK